ncbi:MAG: putative integral rane protein, partial [Acidobacteria bacterium]|nr:putative integral rane protein [Acidobacteriota bacterium]
MMFDESTEPRTAWLARWFAPDVWSSESYLRARWIWLRALGGIFFSAFLALWFQIDGLIGPRGILPATQYLAAVREALGLRGYWLVPSLFWFSASTEMLHGVVIAGLIASVALVCNLWPRLSIAIASIAFLSFVSAAQDFSAYQSDGMLLEAGFLSLFIAPAGLLPGWGRKSLPVRAAMFLLL